MIVHERQRRILRRLGEQPEATVGDLQRDLKVSRSTIRRDLVALEQAGRLVRVHGGVVHRDYLRGEPTLERRRGEAAEAKRAIGQAAARQAPANASVFVDAGTTCLEVGRALMVREDVRIFTNSAVLLLECGQGRATVTAIGGEYRPAGQALVGTLALNWLERCFFDVAFIGASGLNRTGLSTTELSEASVKSAVLGASRRSLLVADGSKWDRPAAVRFAAWNEIDTWITDEATTPAARRTAGRSGVDVTTARLGGKDETEERISDL